MNKINFGALSFTSSIIMGMAMEFIGISNLRNAYSSIYDYQISSFSHELTLILFFLAIILGLVGLVKGNSIVATNVKYSLVGVFLCILQFFIYMFGFALRS